MSLAPTAPPRRSPTSLAWGSDAARRALLRAAAAVRDHEARGRELLVRVARTTSSSTVGCARSAGARSDPLGLPGDGLGRLASLRRLGGRLARLGGGGPVSLVEVPVVADHRLHGGRGRESPAGRRGRRGGGADQDRHDHDQGVQLDRPPYTNGWIRLFSTCW